MAHELTVSELERWELGGATWRVLEMPTSAEPCVQVELCTCYGEAVDRREGSSPELIAYLRARPSSELEAP